MECDAVTGLYLFSSLSADAASLLLAPAFVAQDIAIVGDAGDLFKLQFGPTGTATKPIQFVADDANSIDGQLTAAAIQTALRQLPGYETVVATYRYETLQYRITGLTAADPLLTAPATLPAVTAVWAEGQDVVLSGQPGDLVRLRTAAASTTVQVTLAGNAELGMVDGDATAVALQTALRLLPDSSSATVTFDAAALRYHVNGLAGMLLLDPAPQLIQKSELSLVPGQTFKVRFGDTGSATQLLTAVATPQGQLDGPATAAAIQAGIRTLETVAGSAQLVVTFVAATDTTAATTVT